MSCRKMIPIDFLHALKKRFTGNLRLDAASKILYSTDASMYQIEPLGAALILDCSRHLDSI
jgi:hypothetical protein